MRDWIVQAAGVLVLFAPAAAVHTSAPNGTDIRVNTVGSELQVRAGQSSGVRIEVGNLGDTPSNEITVNIDFSHVDNAVDVVGTEPACSRSGRSYTCVVSSVEPQQTAAIQLLVETAADVPSGPLGSLQITAVTQGDPDTSNNHISLPVREAPKIADLALTQDIPAGQVGEVITVGVTVINNGPNSSGAYELHVAKGLAGLNFVSGASASGRACQAQAGGHRCVGRELAAGESESFSLQFEVVAVQTSYCTLELQSTYPDPDPDNLMLCATVHNPGPEPDPGDATPAPVVTRRAAAGSPFPDVDPFVTPAGTSTASPSTVAAPVSGSRPAARGFTAQFTTAALSVMTLGVLLLLAAAAITIYRRRTWAVRPAGPSIEPAGLKSPVDPAPPMAPDAG